MDKLVVLLTAIIFYFIGRHSMGSSEIENAIKKAKKALHKNKGQIINYPTNEEIEYSGSEQEKIDQQQTKLIKEAGII